MFGTTMALVVASCDSAGQRSVTDDTSAGSTVVEPVVDDEVVVPETTSPPTSPPTTIPIEAPPGAIVAPTLEIIDTQSPPVIAGMGAGFVRLQSTGGTEPVAVLTSADGVNWTTIPSDIGMTYPSRLVSNGASLVAIGVGGDPLVSDRTTVWTSSDGGSHWTITPIESSESDAPYIRAVDQIESVGVTTDLVMLAGTRFEEIDWRSYSIDVVGEDHGNVTGWGTLGDGMVQVSFEDGVDLTIDAADIGLDPNDPSGMKNVVWTLVDGVWKGSEQPAGFLQGMSGAIVAGGPNGVLAVTSSPMTAAAPNGAFVASRTVDGRTWESAPLPEDLRAGGGFPVGGPLGYVVVGSDVLHHTADGLTWTEVHRFDDLDAENNMSPFATASAAGQGGFAVGIPDMGADGAHFRVLTSSDGMTWHDTRMPEGVESVVAVSDVAVLVQPFVRVASVPELPAGTDALRAALASTFSGVTAAGSDPFITSDEAQCIADGLIDSVGEDRLRALGFGAYPWSLLGYGLFGLIERTDAEPMVETFMTCTSRWELLMITSITQGADNISESSAECTAEALDDEIATEMFIKELARDDLDAPPGSADMSYLQGMVNAMDGCLTPTEMNSLDFN